MRLHPIIDIKVSEFKFVANFKHAVKEAASTTVWRLWMNSCTLTFVYITASASIKMFVVGDGDSMVVTLIV